LKATEHIHLALQAAGYWRHVRHHLERDDLIALQIFSRRATASGGSLGLPGSAGPPFSSGHRRIAALSSTRGGSRARRSRRELAAWRARSHAPVTYTITRFRISGLLTHNSFCTPSRQR
jgi:hypothetical protein